MTKRKADEAERNRLKKIWGWGDGQIDNLSSKHWDLIDRGSRFDEYRLIAEVIDAKNCIAGARIGDRYVFHASGFFLPAESTVRRFCLWAMAPMLPFSYMLYERISLDADPTSFSIDRVGCTDVGIEHGGYGKVLFKLCCEKSPPKEAKK